MQFVVEKDRIAEVLQYVREEARRLGVSAKAAHKMELACEEAIVNIFSYAHPNHSNTISIDCKYDDCCHFEVTICDEGPEFNPLEVEIDPQKNIPVGERKIGGLGIYLIRKIIDEAIYLREGNTNILRLILRFECECG